MAFFRNAVSHAFRTYPIMSNSAIFGGMHMIAEFSQQTMMKKFLRDEEEPEEPYNWIAVRDFGLISTCCMSPILCKWYNWLDHKFKGKAMKVVLTKCVMDQVLMTPNILTIFFIGMAILEGHHYVLQELEDKFIATYFTSALFWIPAQLINFAFVRGRYRMVFMSGATFFWVNILCLFKRQELEF